MVKRCSCGPRCTCKSCQCGPHAVFFTTLANENRLAIINALRNAPKNVGQIAIASGLAQAHVSHALRHLQQHGFVTRARAGKQVVYTLNTATIEPLMRLIDAHVTQYCAPHAKPCACGVKS